MCKAARVIAQLAISVLLAMMFPWMAKTASEPSALNQFVVTELKFSCHGMEAGPRPSHRYGSAKESI